MKLALQHDRFADQEVGRILPDDRAPAHPEDRRPLIIFLIGTIVLVGIIAFVVAMAS